MMTINETQKSCLKKSMRNLWKRKSKKKKSKKKINKLQHLAKAKCFFNTQN
nr:MAG TPA: hypothetical protein [Caudoviricetes sp.]